jgi:parallel beta-helix repeat protein
MNRAAARLCCSLMLASVFAAGLSSPADAATTIDCDPLPFVVDHSIKVANDVTDCPTDGLVIAANNITIDLNGHRIDGNELSDIPGGEDAIDNEAGHTGVTVMNGVLQEFERGAALAGDHNSLINVVVVGNTLDGVYTTGTRNVIRSNSISGNASDGIDASLTSSTIAGNTVSGNGQEGIELFGDKNVVAGNTSSENTSHGVFFFSGSDDNVVRRNTVSGNDGDGMRIDNGARNTFEENTVSGNTGEGFDVSQNVESRFLFNQTPGNFGGVIVVGDRMIVRGNNASGNSWTGIEVTGIDNRTIGNVARGNGQDGISIVVSSGTATVRGNRANGNAEQGILAAGPNAKITDNVTKANGFATPGPGDQSGLGIDASGVNTVSGSGNVAVGNDDPDECDPASLC